MSTFDPSKPCVVHDDLNDRTFEWKPEWASNYRDHAEPHNRDDPRVINWDGLLLDGWMELQDVTS